MRFSPVVSIWICVVGCVFADSNFACAEDNLTAAQQEFFEKHIRPAFVKYCYECHSIESGKTRGGLLVDTREGLAQGGESGPAIEPGSLDDSVLWSAITWNDYQMPPEGKMPAETIAHFKKWIEMGAPDPRVREKLVVESNVDIETGKKHWAYQRPHTTATSIDSIVEAKQKAASIDVADAADPLTLLRRLNFDLIGLPPTSDEIRTFLAAWKMDADEAIEAKVDELLERPQYGERWGRYWLDVARYAESSGNTNFTFPHAWRYRDYVIDAFNADTPYNEFIRQQIAGDLLPTKDDEQWQENLIATGFLAIGIKRLGDRNPRTFRMDMIDEQIDTVTQAVLGLTVACARCHDHKFDAIPTADYYALAGIFQSTNTLYGTVFGTQNHRPSDLIILPKPDEEALTQSYGPQQIQGMKDRITSIQKEMQSKRAAARAAGESVVQREMVAMRNQIARLEGVLGTLDEEGKPRTYAMGAMELEEPVDANILVRGDVEMPAQKVKRGFLQVLNDVPAQEIAPDSSGRRELANWLVAEENPLTARVVVNRIWMHLFGEALHRSPNNWGVTSEKPVLPELIDYLAVQFVKNGWSTKQLIREIVLSDVYQRSSQYKAESYEADADNHLLWRMNPRQLDAEAFRDAILAVSGNLKSDRPVASEVTQFGDARLGRMVTEDSFSKTNYHRSVYLPVIRDMVPESLKLFDFADPNAINAQRDETNVPSQALYLMNSQFVADQAWQMASSLWGDYDTQKERIKWAFISAYGRLPTEPEVKASLQFFEEFTPAIREEATQGEDTVKSDGVGRVIGQTSPGQARPGQARPGQARPGGIGRPGGRPRDGRRGPRVRGPVQPEEKLTPEQQALVMFCQSLMASAEFRILN